MSRPVLWILALLALGAGLVGMLAFGPERADRGGAGIRPVADPEPPVVAERDDERGPRDAASMPAPEAGLAVEAAAPKRTFLAVGRAVDPNDAPAVGIALACASDGLDPEGRTSRGVTGRDGSFELELPRAITRIRSADPAWTVVAGDEFRHDGPPLRLVVAPRTSWSGWVVDAVGGAPIPGARVRAIVASSANMRALADLAQPPAVETSTADDGRFALAEVVSWPGTRLEVAAPGYLPYVSEPAPGATDLGLLQLEAGVPPIARGVVRLADGRAAGGARVAVGDSAATAGDDGRFELRVATPAPESALVARLGDHAPARLDGVGRELLRGDVDGLELVLGSEAFAIEGLVTDTDGAPLKRWSVEALEEDGTQAGVHRHTKKDGAFRIAGLGPGPYTVVARGRESDEIAVAVGVEAPRAGLELRRAGANRELTGRVMTATGLPAPGASVELRSPASLHRSTWSARADADGRFALKDVPATAGWLRAEPAAGTTALPTRVAFDPAVPGELELRLGAVRAVRFEAVDAWNAPDALFAVGADGLAREAWGGDRARTTVALDAGRSGVIRLADDAVVLVLVRYGREIARVAIPPTADGEVADVRW